MRKIVCIALFLCFVLSCSSQPFLTVKGDIPRQHNISPPGSFMYLKEVTTTQMLFVAKNGDAVAIVADSLHTASISFEEGVWNLKVKQPGVAGLHDLDYIAVERESPRYQLAVFEGLNHLFFVRPYAEILRGFEQIPLGTKAVIGYTRYKKKESGFVRFFDSIPDSLLVVTDIGEKVYTYQEFAENLVFDGSYFSMRDIPKSEVMIVWKDFPQKSIYDIYPVIAEVSPKRPLLLIFLDGLGASLLADCEARGWDIYLNKIGLEPMRTVYPATTSAAYRVVGTGNMDGFPRGPLKVFMQLDIEKAYILETSHSFVSSKYPVINHTDQNRNGTTDDEIFASALEYLDQDFDMLLVHFHGIDRGAHARGPDGMFLQRELNAVGGYVEELLKKWQGDYIIFSDHGMHFVATGGNHGRLDNMPMSVDKERYGRAWIEDMVGVIKYSIKEEAAE
ncbi:MAG: alkaline phosphatase family protein [Candidatus Cloacimonetes bacterium]|nr:alkaline phosphatase family protein [Candidatus Cloacimonadota bacterium]